MAAVVMATVMMIVVIATVAPAAITITSRTTY